MSPVGFGCWQWGNEFLWNYNKVDDSNLEKVFEFSKTVNNAWFDTAEVYGKDYKSEYLLGKFIESSDKKGKPLVLTKCTPQIWKIGKESLIASGQSSLSRLGTSSIDLYQLHWPPTPFLWQEREYVEGLVRQTSCRSYITP
jgi:aryl-alcohol dehydrogenase-like predicted oxidoreductase